MRSAAATSMPAPGGSSHSLGARRQKTDLHVAEPSAARSSSPAPSLRSQRARQYRASLPVRTARLLQRSRAQTPSDAGVSDGSASPAPAPASLLQDVVDIKTLLLQLKRVLQEPGEEHHTMSSETLDPLLAVCAESPARGNGRRPPAPPAAAPPAAAPAPLHPDAQIEMRRQILYLQSQLEERDRLVRVLQQQMLRMADTHEPRHDDTCNRATQTDRLRPPMSTALTSSENSGLVSWNEQASGRKLPLYSEAQKTRRVANGSANKVCQCGGRRAPNDDGGRSGGTGTGGGGGGGGGRVGARYLQAVVQSLHSRSRSIDNFDQQPPDEYRPGRGQLRSPPSGSRARHYTSYGDLRAGGEARRSPGRASHSTDTDHTDYSSDGGYKSLPSSIDCDRSPKKVSGIPRRSLDHKFSSPKHVKASAI